MTEIRNTTEDMQDPTNATMFLLESLRNGGDPGSAIEAMEARGQRELVHSDQLPVKVQDEGLDAAYLALGFTFGDPYPNDPMFRPATLPAGWFRKATDHSMWSKLIDEHGRERVSIFYKAAFYDRSAHMYLTSHHAYLNSMLFNDEAPVLDQVWLTAEMAVAELEKIAARAEKEAVESDDFASRTKDPAYWTERAAEHRADAMKARKLRDSLAAR